jgi:alpha-1,2-mannosyltransferase
MVTRFAAARSTYGLRLLFDPVFLRVAIGLVLALVLALRVALLLVLSSDVNWGYDLSAYLNAGRLILDGQSPYAPFQLEGTYSPHLRHLYIYPPFTAVLAAPLAALFPDYRIANWLWAAVGATLLLVTTLAIARRDSIAAGWSLVLLVMAAFAFAPINDEFFIGNVHLLLVGLVGGAWLALRGSRPRGELVAGALIGIATLIKVFPGVLIVWLLLTGRSRGAITAVVTMAVLALATLPVTGLQPWLDYPVVLLNLGPPVNLENVLAPSAWLSELVPSTLARILVTVVGLAIVWWATVNRSQVVSYAVAVTVSVLISPALYHHYLAVLVVPLLLGIRHSSNVAWIVVAFLLLSVGHQPILGDASWIAGRLLPTLGALLTLGGLLVWGHRRESLPPETHPAFSAKLANWSVRLRN